MRQFYLQRQFYHLAKKRIIQPTKDDQERMRLLNIWVAMRRKGIKSKEVIKAIGVSRATLYRWQRRVAENGWQGIKYKSRHSRCLRKAAWKAEIVDGVRSL